MTTWYNAHIVLIQGTYVILLLALSIQIPVRMGVFSFASIGFYGIGGYTAAIVTIRYGWHSYLAIVAGMVVAAVAGLVLGPIVQRLSGLYLAMATIAFSLILTVVARNGGSLTGGANGLFGAISSLSMSVVLVVIVLILGLVAWTERGRLGRRIEVLREDPQLARSLGIHVRRLRLLSFVVSGLLGGMSGGLNALFRTEVSPDDLGFSLVVTALTIIIVGGARSWLGALIGAIIFTWLPSILTVVGQWQAVIYSAIVALAAVWLPGGLVGLATNTYRASDARRRARSGVTTGRATTSSSADSPEIAALGALTADNAGSRS